MEARWSGQAIQGIRQLEQQQFLVRRGHNPGVQPETVIESRLTPLVERFSSSGVESSDPSRTTYHWSYEAPLGPLQFLGPGGVSSTPTRDSRVAVSGDLMISAQNNFELSQQSRLTQSAGTQTVSSLIETARGLCYEQR